MALSAFKLVGTGVVLQEVQRLLLVDYVLVGTFAFHCLG